MVKTACMGHPEITMTQLELEMATKARVFNEITDSLLTVLDINAHIRWWEAIIPGIGRTPCELWLAGEYETLRGLVTFDPSFT